MKTIVMLLLSDWATLSKGPVSNFPSILLALLLWLLLTWCGEAGDERLTNACSFFALHLPFESKGIAGNAVLLLSPCFSIFSPLSVLFLLSVFPWVFFFRPLGLCYALPFIRPRELAPKPVLPLQDCYPSTNEIVGRERGHDWVGFAADFPASLLNRDEEDARLFPSNGAVSAEMEIFTLTPASGNLTIGSRIKKIKKFF